MLHVFPRCFISLAVFFVVIQTQQLQAGTIRYVDVDASGTTHDGSSWCSAFIDLQDALAVAVATDVIRIADGTYRPDRGTGNRELSFQLKSGVEIYGGYAGCNAVDPDARNISNFETILSGDLAKNDGADFSNYGENSFHVVAAINVDSAGLLDGVTVSGGNADGPNFGPDPSSKDQGSGINNYWSTARYENCTLRNNYSANHGAFNDHGGATLINCTLEDNESGMWGGGLFVAPNIAATVTGCKFINNHTVGSAGGGGGIANGGDSVFTNCLIQGNTSDTVGAGVYIHSQSKPQFLQCEFRENLALVGSSAGGGMYAIQASQPTVDQCFFILNRVNQRAPAIYCAENGVLTITSSYFTENRSSQSGAVYSQDGLLYISDSIFFDNFGNYGGAVYAVDNDTHLDRCSFIDNRTSVLGSGYVAQGGQSVINNCLFNGNLNIVESGVIAATQIAHLDINNCTIYNNQSKAGGAFNFADPRVTATINNCIVWGNWSVVNLPMEMQQIVSWDYTTIQINHSCIEGWSGMYGGVNNRGLDPKFIDPLGPDNIAGTEDDNLRLSASSPYLDVGDSTIFTDPAEEDLEGNLREQHCRIDLGAYESSMFADCQSNSTPDACEINSGTANDCSGNHIPDECEPDCNNNSTPDSCDIVLNTSNDCDDNGIPDECQDDCDQDGLADACILPPVRLQGDCNHNGVPDGCDIASTTSIDCNEDLFPDECGRRLKIFAQGSALSLMFIRDLELLGHEVDTGLFPSIDFNKYEVVIITGGSFDASMERFLQGGGGLVLMSPGATLDENPLYHPVESWSGITNLSSTSIVSPNNPLVDGLDTNSSLVALTAVVVVRASAEVAIEWGGGVPMAVTYEYEGSKIAYLNNTSAFFNYSNGSWRGDHDYGLALLVNAINYVSNANVVFCDCNLNGVADDIDIASGTSDDCTGNAVPDECEPDCDGNGVADSCEIFDGLDDDCNNNLIPDLCDVASGLEPDCNGNQIPDQCDIDSGFSFDVNNNQIPDHCETDCNGNDIPDAFEISDGMGTDCNNNVILDACEMNNVNIVDCNGNNVLDECDIADGTSFDVNDNCIPDECNQTPMPLAEEFPVNKNRFITFIPVNASCSTAIRITLSSLHHPDPPLPDSPDFTEFEGQVRWAGSPNTFAEDSDSEVMFWASSLQCEPYFTDWSSGTPESSLLHLFGDAIVPGSTYLIEVVGDDCFDLNDPNCYSDALEVSTGRWGDVEAPFQSVGGPNQPTIDDVLATVKKWLGSLKPVKVQSILQANVPNPSEGVSVNDVLQVVNAWLSAPYPFAGPETCP